MSEYRISRIYRAFYLAMIVICFISGNLRAKTPQLPLDDPTAVIRILIPAIKSIKLPTTGQGIAIVKSENYNKHLDSKENLVHFAFKGQKSRADFFEYDGRYRGPRLNSIVRTDKNSIRFNSQVYISHPDGWHGYEIGWDFRPETFLRMFGTTSLGDWLEYQLKPQANLPLAKREMSIELDKEGVLQIIVRYDSVSIPKYPRDVTSRTAKISFDSHKDYLPVYFERQSTRADDSEFTGMAKLEWSRFGSEWYISTFESSILPGNLNHIVGTIKEFKTDVQVSDIEFTFEGMGIPDSTYVHDNISRERYQYESPESFFGGYEIPEKEAEPVQRIRKQQSTLMNITKRTDSNDASQGEFYLRAYQTGRLIGPLSLKHGSILPPMSKETYIVVKPNKYELKMRKQLCDSRGYESTYLDCMAFEVIGTLGKMIKNRLGDKSPKVRIDENIKNLISMKIGKEESAYEVLFRIAVKTQARIFIEDGAVVLSRKKLTELANPDTTTSETVAKRERPSR